MLSNQKVRNTKEQLAHLQGLGCQVPFSSFHIYEDGEVTNCCYSWMPKLVGNITKTSLLEMYRGGVQKEIQESVTNGSFKFCDCTLCPSLSTQVSQGATIAPLVPLDKVRDEKTIKIYLNRSEEHTSELQSH